MAAWWKQIFVTDQNDKREIAELRELNDELTDSLRRCRAILKDCRDHLAANSNEEGTAQEQHVADELSRSG